nr:hypothetical protein [Tanacetum cinerariifolium]
MNQPITQQVALDNPLVSPEDQIVIGKCNMRIDPTKTQKEDTYQVVLDILKLSPCSNAFLVTADDDSVLGKLKFVNKGEDNQVYRISVLNVIVNDDIKNSKSYQTYLAISTDVEQLASNTQKAIKACNKAYRLQQQSEGLSEGADKAYDDEKHEIADEEMNDDENADEVKDDQVIDDAEKTTPTPTLTTPLPTPPIPSEAPTITATVPDPLLAVTQRLSGLERKFETWTKVDHSEAIEVSDQGKKKRRKGKDYELSKDKVQTGSSSNGKTQSNPSSNIKTINADKLVEEPIHKATIDVEEPTMDDVVNDLDQPQDETASRKDNSIWFKQPPRPETPDPEWNQDKATDDGP